MSKAATLSKSTEQYLQVILELQSSEGAVRVKDIALKLGILKGSVSGAVKKLKESGFIDYTPYQPIRLTTKGQHTAERIIRRNRVLELYFSEMLGLETGTAQRAARCMGHSAEEMVIEGMQRVLGEHGRLCRAVEKELHPASTQVSDGLGI
jgi:DtxR family Mn-dependent transcriptional regulator